MGIAGCKGMYHNYTNKYIPNTCVNTYQYHLCCHVLVLICIIPTFPPPGSKRTRIGMFCGMFWYVFGMFWYVQVLVCI